MDRDEGYEDEDDDAPQSPPFAAPGLGDQPPYFAEERASREDRPPRDERGPREDRPPREDRFQGRDRPYRDDRRFPPREAREDRGPREDRPPREDRRPPREDRGFQPRPVPVAEATPAQPEGDLERLPAFITGGAAAAAPEPRSNGHEGDAPDRFPYRRRRRGGRAGGGMEADTAGNEAGPSAASVPEG